MKQNKIISFEKPEQSIDPLQELIRNGARQLIQTAIESELSELLYRNCDKVSDSGHAGVVRNGYLPERELQTGIGPVSTYPQGALPHWSTDHLSICFSAAVCA